MTRFDTTQSRFSSVRTWSRIVGVLAVTLVISACGAFKSEVDPTAGWSAERLYESARTEVSDGNWKDARTKLEAVEARYPFGGYAQQALMELAYVNWKDDEPEQALAAIDRFQQQYPNHPGNAYMLYLKGLITFTPPSAFLSRMTRQDPSERDPKGLRESYEAFNELVKRYPDSRYTEDARKRIAWLVTTIAQNEIHVAEYYYKRKAYLAAANRAQAVISDFKGIPVAEKALYIMYLSYDKLNMPDLRDDAKRVLDENYPDSKYYAQGLDEPRNIWNPVNWF